MGVRGGFDIAFDNILSILETYSAAQPTDEQFAVFPDYYRNFPAGKSGAFVFLYMGPISPTSQVGQAYFAYDVDYNLDLVALGKGTQGVLYSRADKAAGIRLRYLIQQVLVALFQADNRNLNLPAGTVSKKPMLRIEPLPPEMQMSERPIVGARLTLSLGLAWEPDALTGEDLTDIYVTADKWSALINP